ncbi:MAG: hypothetical protein HY900_36645 [Deltaproteobacteria bacterium]|nr:hypothetical protein [Deltaproteobacteria bacterium]
MAENESDVGAGAAEIEVVGERDVRRGMMEHASGDFQASMDATVVVADSTKVLRQAEGEEVQRTIQEISVGQRISAFGTLSGTTGTYTLDASEGLVRLLVSEAEGLVSELPPGELTLDLQQLGGTSIDRLDFGGTGSTPTAYRVDLGGLSVSGLSVGAPVVVRGFVAPFGAAPPDFEAVSVSW